MIAGIQSGRTSRRIVAAFALLLAATMTLAGTVSMAGAKKRKHRSHVVRCSGTTTPIGSMSPDLASSIIACLINRERTSHGLSKLKSQPQLRAAAQAHNADMQQNLHAFTHAASNGDSLEQRVGRSGYMRRARRWTVGEILDQTTTPAIATPTDFLNAWLNSPVHNHVIHVGKFRDFGVFTSWGTAENPSYGNLVTVDFGYRKK
jgi:uncharacterized protein YkwD